MGKASACTEKRGPLFSRGRASATAGSSSFGSARFSPAREGKSTSELLSILYQKAFFSASVSDSIYLFWGSGIIIVAVPFIWGNIWG